MTLEDIKRAAIPACREFDVGRLDAFGSIARGVATMSSDVDLLVEFKAPTRSPAKRFFGLLHRLEDVLGCKVDLVTVNSLKNPYFKRRRVPGLTSRAWMPWFNSEYLSCFSSLSHASLDLLHDGWQV